MFKPNEELDKLIEHKNTIHFIKAQRLRRLRHVERVPEERDVKKIYKWKLIASRQVGRWKDNVMRASRQWRLLIGKGEHRIEMNGSQAGQNSYGVVAPCMNE
jgi:hypothetical protein